MSNDHADQIKLWIQDNNPAAGEFDNHTPLLENKILTSVQIMDLVLFLEHLQNKPLDIDQVQPENFYSINKICHAFFGSVSS